jgi:hypothetical protein
MVFFPMGGVLRGFPADRSGFKTFNQVQSPPLKLSGIKRRSEGFNRRNIFNISSIEPLGPTQELGLRGGFETTSKYFLVRLTANPCAALPNEKNPHL